MCSYSAFKDIIALSYFHTHALFTSKYLFRNQCTWIIYFKVLYILYTYIKNLVFFLKIKTCISHNQIFIGWTLIFQTQKNVPCTCINTHLSIRLYIFSLDISMGPSSSDPAASVSRYMSKHISNLCIWLDSTVSHDFEFINSSWWTFTSSSISCYSRKKKVLVIIIFQVYNIVIESFSSCMFLLWCVCRLQLFSRAAKAQTLQTLGQLLDSHES